MTVNTIVCDLLTNFYPHQIIQWFLMPWEWGRSYSRRNHSHQARNVSLYKKRSVRSIWNWFGVNAHYKGTRGNKPAQNTAFSFPVICDSVWLFGFNTILPSVFVCCLFLFILFVYFLIKEINNKFMLTSHSFGIGKVCNNFKAQIRQHLICRFVYGLTGFQVLHPIVYHWRNQPFSTCPLTAE